jgi:hypothetical protein
MRFHVRSFPFVACCHHRRAPFGTGQERALLGRQLGAKSASVFHDPGDSGPSEFDISAATIGARQFGEGLKGATNDGRQAV